MGRELNRREGVEGNLQNSLFFALSNIEIYLHNTNIFIYVVLYYIFRSNINVFNVNIF